MRKRLLTGVLVVAMTMVMTGCCLSHEWQDATCTTPKTCGKCQEVEGEALGHTWTDATCTEAKKCSVCGATEGSALGHTWADATCTEAKKCSACGATEGEALGHKLTEATYQQPVTCTVCGKTEGDVLPPTASAEDIAALQAKVDAFVETYNTGNQAVIDELSRFIAGGETDEDADTMVQVYKNAYESMYGGDYDWIWCVNVIPMAFYNNVNEGLIGQWTFDEYMNTTGDTINSYMHVAQADEEHMTTWGIIFYATMEYAKEIATGNPKVLDIITYEEPMTIEAMDVRALRYGILDVGGEIYYAYMIGDDDIVDIYPADEEYFAKE